MLQPFRLARLRPIVRPTTSRSISASFQPRASTAAVADTDKIRQYPIISGTNSQLEIDLAHAATTTGLAHIPSIEGRKAPFNAISKLFDRLYAEPHLATRLNSTYAKRGVFKTAGLNNPQADQKTTIDLSAKRLENIQRLAPELVQELGQDFKEILEFFYALEGRFIPSVMRASNAAAGVNLEALHAGRNNNFRLVDYFANQSSEVDIAPRCGSHRDYGTFSVIL